MKTTADWIQVKLHEKEVAPYHLAAKMGIASALVNAWKDGIDRPKACHIREMVAILGKYRRSLPKPTATETLLAKTHSGKLLQ